MMDPFEELRLLKQLLTQEAKYYFYYDIASGEIISIMSYMDPNEFNPYIEISVNDPLVNTDVLNKIYYEAIEVDNKRILARKKINFDSIKKIDDIIYKIPREYINSEFEISEIDYKFDILIEQNTIKKEFRIRMSGYNRDQYDHTIESKNVLVFYVTADNDPTILYKKLEIPVKNLISNKYFSISYDTEIYDCNIFSNRYFQDYKHLVIQ